MLNQKTSDTSSEEPMAKLITQGVNNLPEEYKVVISFKHYHNYSCKEIARILREPIGTITSRLSRAYQLLKNEINTQKDL